MNTPDSNTAGLIDLSKLQAELKEWALGIRCVLVTLNLLPLYYCTRILLTAPKFATIFEDMLGSKDKLPMLTRFVIEWSLPLLGLLWLLSALAIALIFLVKRARFAWVTAVVMAIVLIVTGHLTVTLLFEPLILVIQNLSGGSEISR